LVRYITENEENTVFEPTPVAYLILLVNGRDSQSFPLRGTIHLGRDKSNSVVVADQKVSRHHATLTPIDDTFILIDQGSANGTFLNGVLVSQPTRLKPGDRVAVGDTEFAFSIAAPNPDGGSAVPPPLSNPAVVVARSSYTQAQADSRPIWALVGCLGLVVITLLLALALLMGLLLGHMQLVTGLPSLNVLAGYI